MFRNELIRRIQYRFAPGREMLLDKPVGDYLVRGFIFCKWVRRHGVKAGTQQ
jgi:hypothetical protein